MKRLKESLGDDSQRAVWRDGASWPGVLWRAEIQASRGATGPSLTKPTTECDLDCLKAGAEREAVAKKICLGPLQNDGRPCRWFANRLK